MIAKKISSREQDNWNKITVYKLLEVAKITKNWKGVVVKFKNVLNVLDMPWRLVAVIGKIQDFSKAVKMKF